MLGTLLLALVESGKVAGSVSAALTFVTKILGEAKAAAGDNAEVGAVIDTATAKIEELGVQVTPEGIKAALTEFVGIMAGGVFGPPDPGAGSIF